MSTIYASVEVVDTEIEDVYGDDSEEFLVDCE